jgi:hypothetical protein
MLAAKFIRKVVLSLMIFIAVWALGMADKPVANWLREYVAFAVSTDIDLSPITSKVKLQSWWPVVVAE